MVLGFVGFSSLAVFVLLGLLLAGAVLIVLAWRGVSHLPPIPKWAARVVLLAVVLGPIALLALTKLGSHPETAHAPPSMQVEDGERERDAIGAPQPAPPPRKSKPERAPDLAEKKAAEANEPDPPSAGAAPPPGGGATRGLIPTKPDASVDVSTEAESPRAAVEDETADIALPADVNSDWDVVPVFYGTDRARQPNEKRIDYNANRARRLELGQALVTVPKSHQQPKIERPWKVSIPYFNVTLYEEKEDPKQHFTMQNIKALTKDSFLTLARERLGASETFKDHAFVFVHGYNTSFDLAVYRTAQIAYDLQFDGAPFLYSWPSGGNVQSYTYDLGSATQSEPFLRDYLMMVATETGAKKISVIAHSMGNQPLLRVLQDLSRSTPPGVTIDELILAAPDVDRDNFLNVASSLTTLAKGITLYAAGNDRALDIAQRFHGGIPRAGDVPAAGPLVVAGVDTIDVTAVSMDALGLRHSGYAENNTLLRDIAKLILSGTRPPKSRVPLLEEVTVPDGMYWRYPAVVP